MFYAEGKDQARGLSDGKEGSDCKTKSLRREGMGPERKRSSKGMGTETSVVWMCTSWEKNKEVSVIGAIFVINYEGRSLVKSKEH